MAASQDDIGRLIVSIEANTKAYEASLNKALGITNKSAQQIERRFSQMSKNIGKGFDLSSLNTALTALGAGFTTKELVAYADAWTGFSNKLAATGVPIGQVGAKLDQLTQVANDARSPLEGVVSLYSRLNLSADNLNASQDEIVQSVSNVTKAMTLSGASVLEMNSAVLQFSQAISSGVLQGDELRSLRENAPLIAQAIAKEFGVSIGELKKLGEEGRLTSDRVLKAITSATDGINAAFDKTTPTIAQATTVLNNAFTQFIGTSGTVQASAQVISESLLFLAKNLDGVADALIILAAGFAGLFLGPAIVTGAKNLLGLTAALAALLRAAAGGGGALLALQTQLGRVGPAAAGARAGMLGLAAATKLTPFGMFVTAGIAAGAMLELFANDTQDAQKNAEDFSGALDRAAQAQEEMGRISRMIAQGDLKAASDAYGVAVESADKFLQKRKEIAEQERQLALGQAVESSFDVKGLGAAMDTITAKALRLEEALVQNAQFELSSEGSEKAVARIQAQVEKLRQELAKEQAIELGVDPKIFLDLNRVRTELRGALSAGDNAAAETLVGQALDIAEQLPSSLRNNVIKPLLDTQSALASITGSDYNVKISSGNLDLFNRLLNNVKSDSVDLQYVLENLGDFAPGSLGVREFNELQQALLGADMKINALKANVDDYVRGPLTKMAEKGNISFEFLAQVQELSTRFKTGAINANTFALELSKLSGMAPNFAPALGQIQQMATQATQAEGVLKKLNQAQALAPKGGPTKAFTDKPSNERSEFQKQIDYLRSATVEANRRADALRKLNPESAEYNRLLLEESIYAEKRRAIESAGKSLKPGSSQDKQLRADAAKLANAKISEDQIEASRGLERQMLNEMAALGRTQQEYAKLNPLSADYAEQKLIADEYLGRLEKRLSNGIPLLQGEAEAIRASAEAYAKRAAAVAGQEQLQGALQGAQAQVEALAKERDALEQLTPASADYILKQRQMQEAKALYATAAQNNIVLTDQQKAAIENLSLALATLGMQMDAISSNQSWVKSQQDAAAAANAEAAALQNLNPWLGDYELKAKAAALAAAEIARQQAAGVALSPAQIQAIKDQADATVAATDANEKLKQTQQEYNNLSRDATKGFVRDLLEGKKASDALASALGKVADKLLDIALDSMFTQNSMGGIGGFLGSLFGRAGGGAVNKGQPYVVGESGREVFVPNRDGRIIPNKDLRGNAGAGGGAVVNINNYSGQQVQQTSRREGDRQIIDIVVGEVSRRMSQGAFDKPMGARYGANTQTMSR